MEGNNYGGVNSGENECLIFREWEESGRKMLVRKRKRRISDAVSVCSLDISLASEQENKRKRGLSKVVSLANLLSTPMRPVRKIGTSLQVCHDV
ncbi:hypothetical protein Cfor_08283 [Coptotermes formosanus]|uniref:Uncharacterized protein n=1 Tax=Coptotermes formosanus TaxID=36987 RepID=A0A6L2PYA8_COPFO|nr:hypothetical protein Cfor_08283 [Coptotermes formosanus]